MRKKVAKRKLIGFTAEAIQKLAEEVERTGKTETQVVIDKVIGKDRFESDAEAYIVSEMKETAKGREELIQAMILELKRFRLLHPSPGPPRAPRRKK